MKKILICLLIGVMIFSGCSNNNVSINNDNVSKEKNDEIIEDSSKIEEDKLVEIFSSSYIKDEDSENLEFNHVYAKIIDSDIEFIINYESSEDRIMHYFNPPNGAKVKGVFSLKKSKTTVDFRVSAEDLSGIDEITIKDNDENYLYLPNIQKALNELTNENDSVDKSNEEEDKVEEESINSEEENYNEYSYNDNFDYEDEGTFKPLDYKRGKLMSLDAAIDKYSRYDFKSYDMTEINITEKVGEKILNKNFVFDSKTKWPDNMPDNFDPQEIMRLGKNPGLNIDKLHERGITGKGINIGIVDTKLLLSHKEIKHSLISYEEIKPRKGEVHHHGTMVTSILTGKNIGIAPDAKVHYVAYEPGNCDADGIDNGWVQLAKAIKRIVEINKKLPNEEKMRVLSISSGWAGPEESPEYYEKCKEIYEALDMAREENIFVITARSYETDQLFFSGLKRDIYSDPNSVKSYNIKTYAGSATKKPDKILDTPMDCKCLASATGDNDYVFYKQGGWSFVVPYISGVYTLACQVKPDITPNEFWNLAMETGYYAGNKDGIKRIIINPLELIDRISK